MVPAQSAPVLSSWERRNRIHAAKAAIFVNVVNRGDARTYGALHFSRGSVFQGYSPPHMGFGTSLVPRPAGTHSSAGFCILYLSGTTVKRNAFSRPVTVFHAWVVIGIVFVKVGRGDE
jgi:hypothetical protein